MIGDLFGLPHCFYRLNEQRDVVPCSFDEWGKYFGECDRIVGSDLVGPVTVSTVFLGIPHHGGMFETCLFWDDGVEIVQRYETYDKAKAGHNKWTAKSYQSIPLSRFRREKRWRKRIAQGDCFFIQGQIVFDY